MNRRAFLFGTGAIIATAATGVTIIAPPLPIENLQALLLQRFNAALAVTKQNMAESLYSTAATYGGGLAMLIDDSPEVIPFAFTEQVVSIEILK